MAATGGVESFCSAVFDAYGETMHAPAFASALLLALVACNKPSSSKATVAGSCLLKVKATGKPSSCGEYTDAAAGKAICDAVAGRITALTVTWSAAPCPSVGVLARCAIPADPAAGLPASRDSYYAAAFAADSGKAACAESRGQWSQAVATAIRD